jgi:hypothetical protein
MNKFFAAADHAGSVPYIVGIILTNYWQTAKLGAPHYYGNHVCMYFVYLVHKKLKTHPKESFSDYITKDTHCHQI